MEYEASTRRTLRCARVLTDGNARVKLDTFSKKGLQSKIGKRTTLGERHRLTC